MHAQCTAYQQTTPTQKAVKSLGADDYNLLLITNRNQILMRSYKAEAWWSGDFSLLSASAVLRRCR